VYPHPKSLAKRALYLMASSAINASKIEEVLIPGYGNVRLPTQLPRDYAEVVTIIPQANIRGDSERVIYVSTNRVGLAYLNGRLLQGFGKHHELIWLGKESSALELKLRFFRTGFLGSHADPPRLEGLTHAIVLKDGWILGLKALHLIEAAEAIRGVKPEVSEELLNLVRDALDKAYVEAPPLHGLSFVMEVVDPSLASFPPSTDELRVMMRERPSDLVEAGFRGVDEGELLRGVREGLQVLADGLKELRRKWWKEGRVHAVAISHLDAAWLWPYSEGRLKAIHTFINALRLISEFKDLTYAQSSPQYYEWVREAEPDLLERVREAVKRGAWEAVGGMWVESDAVLPGLESMVRQFYYGQKWFERELSIRASIAWLQDSFGFNPILPQIMRQAGIKYFLTHKLEWSTYNRFPHTLFRWRGIDGSEVLTAQLGRAFVETVTAERLLSAWREHSAKDILPKALVIFGYSDGGGGPNEEQVLKLKTLGEAPVFPEVGFGSTEEYFREAEKLYDSLPVWFGELYLEAHRGVFTTNLRLKKLVFALEAALRHAETAWSLAHALGAEYPGELLDNLWMILLRNEFHDVLCGTCTTGAHEEAYAELEEALRRARALLAEGVRRLAEIMGEGGVVAFNPLSWGRTSFVEVSEGAVRACREAQPLGNGKVLVAVNVPPLGIIDLSECVGVGEVSVGVNSEGVVIENEFFRAVLRADGRLVSFFSKELGREMLRAPSNVIVAYDDKPREWDAWEIDEDYDRLSWIVNDGVVNSPEVLEAGPLRARVRFRWRFRSSEIVEDVVAYGGRRELLFNITFRWRERNIMLKAWFDADVNASRALFDVGAGYLERATHTNTSWERAKYEVFKHKWVALEDDQALFAVISHERNGVTVRFSKVGLTLLKSPTLPDPVVDSGELSTYYAITALPSNGKLLLTRIAYEVSNPVHVVTVSSPREGKGDGLTGYVLRVDGGVIVENVKKCSDLDKCLVLRVYNPMNSPVRAVLRFGIPVDDVWECNILEDKVRRMRIRACGVNLTFKPFEIKSVCVLFQADAARGY